MTARFSRMMAVVAAISVTGLVHAAAPAGAIGPTTFSMSPTSGPAGTDVSVSGNGCAPGLLLSSSLDRVVVTMASAPSASAQIPVTSSGAWSGTITVPANAAAAPALVTVLCFTDGLQSLLTLYVPKTFTVTAAAAPTTTTDPGSQPAPTTLPEQTQQPPSTQPPGRAPGNDAGNDPGNDSGPTPTTTPGRTHTTQPDASGPGAGVPSGGSDAPGAGPSVPGHADNGSGATRGDQETARGKRADTLSVAADLQAPDLTSTTGGDGGSGLGWIGWLALALLVAGAVAGGLLFRRYRRSEAQIPRPG